MGTTRGVDVMIARVETVARRLDPSLQLQLDGQLAPVIPIGALARYDLPTPSLAGYDDLLADQRTGSRS